MPQLPALAINPQNALLDVSPVTNALQGLTDQRNRDRQFGMEQERLDMERESHKQSMANSARSWKQNDVEMFGKQAMAVDSLPETDPRRALIWNKIVQKHGAGGLSPEEIDHRTGPKLMAAQAGMFKDPAQEQARSLDMEYKRAQINNLNRKQEPDPVDQFILQRLQGGQRPQQGPAQMLQPQSFNLQGQQPGLQLIADQQAAPQIADTPAPRQVQTPFGTMSEQEARDLAGPMLLSPKYAAAGRAILDSIGASGEAGLAKPSVNQIEERTLNSAGQLARIGDIMQKFDPKFLEIPKRLEMFGASLTAKAGGKLPPDVEAELGRYASFRASAVNNLNAILKELSGAAVTPQEYERIQNEQPVAGTGVFDGDDPVSFKAKAERTSAALKAAIARLNFMRARGLNFDRGTLDQFMRLEDVPAAIDRRGAEIEQQLRQANPKADPMMIEKNVRNQLKQEFGI